jgi:hypothetical protein
MYMGKPSKKRPNVPLPPPKVRDLVGRVGSKSVYQVTRVSHDGTEVDLCLVGTDLEWFRVPVGDLVLTQQEKSSTK